MTTNTTSTTTNADDDDDVDWYEQVDSFPVDVFLKEEDVLKELFVSRETER